ncbi:MAG: hypothetical protein Q9M34_11620 [Sulfurimonas sp.]|nr:hypothetical protein [Sulfurimonas sp.]
MQRKNSLLGRTTHKKIYKSGMAMIMAIIVIVTIATIMALSLSLSSQTSKRTTDLYLYEQAVVLAHSSVEYAMLKASQTAPCSISTLNFQYPTVSPIYNISISMQYISTVGSTCQVNALAAGAHYETITNTNSNGTTIIDVSVSSLPNVATEQIRYFRRTIQKL